MLKAVAISDAVAAIVIEAGFGIASDDFNNAQAEISEEQLEDVPGGGTTTTTFLTTTTAPALLFYSYKTSC